MLENTRKQIFKPLIYALLIAIGVFIGRNFFSHNGTSPLLLYPQTNKLDVLFNLIDEEYVDTINSKKIIESLIPDILKNLDPHSVYIPAKDLSKVNEELQGNFGGIGVQFSMQNDTILVIKVISGGPSEKTGLLAGDRIVTVNDTALVGAKVTTLDVMNKLRGEMGTLVKVGVVRRPGKEIVNYTITRGAIPMYSVDVSYMVDERTGYIKVDRFAQTTYTEFLTALAKLRSQNCKQVMVDMRGNSGGLLDVAISMCNEFLAKDELIVYTQGKSHKRQDVFADGNGKCQDMKVVVLIDEYSASASEIFAGAIQDNDRGVVVGRRSFGKGLVQQQIPLPDGSAVRLTVARYYTPAGRCIQKSYDNGNEDYYHDLMTRYEHGEFFTQDSIVFNDSLKYTTKGGRTVYGGGGIMPDVFVPRDTTYLTPYYMKLRSSGSIYSFSLSYVDRNREVLDEMEDVAEIKSYLDKQAVMQQFLTYVASKKIVFNKREFAISEKLIDAELKAYIARNIIDNDGFYPILNPLDEVFIKGLDAIHKK